ncbi:MAG: ComF family protein [Candidatus Harrisonbacteria bacterium]|nr:ComF family protein [Candidatus Harrisonbacteria bacterium]
MSNLIKLKELALDILFPPICLNCENSLVKAEKNNGICDLCLSKIIIHTTLFCPTCRARLPENKKTCHQNSAYLLGAAADYDGAVKNIIRRLKYKSWSRLKNPIGYLLKIYLKNLKLDKAKLKNYLVIPIPLHKNRERERGFNQAELIGKIISEKYNLPLAKGILIRNKETKSQTELKNWDERKNNLTGAFKIENAEYLKNKNIILVDDVYTSGATVNEAVKTLRTAGAKKIVALVIAKTK